MHSMIVVKLMGGLGNHLFQYAVGRHLAEIHGTALKLDLSFFATYDLHTYSIWPFNIIENIASEEEVRYLKYGKQSLVGRAVRRALRKTPVFSATYCKESGFQFDSSVLCLPDGVYLEGYWQSEKYFSGIAELIRREFTVKTPPTGRNEELGTRMASCEAVSMHIRRGSYLKPPYNEVHGTCSMAYYSRCVSLVAERVRDPHFFVFSDDPQWANDNLELEYPTTVVDHNGAETDFEDLRLMTRCKHHIVANSTFSWWGAWLSQREGKTVFAPRLWFAKDEVATDDLIPVEWVRV
jgi:hypothetical protein